MKRKLSGIVVLCVMLALVLSGCPGKGAKVEASVSVDSSGTAAGQGEAASVDRSAYVGFDGIDPGIEGEVTIYRYYAGADKVCMDYAVDKLAKKYPGLKINIEHRTDSDGTAIKTWAAVGELPDIFEITSFDAYESLMGNGDLYVMDDAIQATGFYDLFSNGPASQSDHTNKDGHQYSMACEVNHVLVLWYNSELFGELGLSEPTNYVEFKHTVEVLRNAGKVPIALFGAEQWPGAAFYSLAAIAEGKDEGVEAVNDGIANIKEDPYVRAAEKYAEIADMGGFGSGALSTNYQQAFEMMFNKQAGYFISGTWFWSTIEESNMGDKTDWCNYNVFADDAVKEEVQGKCVGGKIKEMQYSVNANPPSGLDPHDISLLACEFEYYVRLCAAEAGNMTTVLGDFEFNGSESYADFNRSYGNFKTFTTLTGDMSNGDFVSALGNAVEMLVTSNYSADEFIEDLESYGY